MIDAPFDELLLVRVRTAAEQWSPAARMSSFQAVTKGSSSLTYRASVTDSEDREITAYIKVAPPNLPPVRNRDVLRQAAVLRVLDREGSVPVPRVLFEDPGSPPEVPPFFATESAAGSSLEPLVDDVDPPPADEMTARAIDAAETLAKLHRVDPRLLHGYVPEPSPAHADLAFEVHRWARIFATVEGDLGAAAQSCAARLLARPPEPLAPVVVHGDFRLGNVVCLDAQVKAVLDWEIWSITDPRVDVAWFLMTLSAHGLPSAVRESVPGLPSPEYTLRVYERAAGIEVQDLEWFAALSRFRAAAAMSLNIKHNRRRPNPNPRIESYAEKLPQFLALATDLIG